MPDKPFDRTIINPREKPLSEDVNRYLSQLDRATRFFAKSIFSTTVGSPVSGFVQGGFRAIESSPVALSVVLKAGLGFQDIPGDVPTTIDGVEGLDDLESYKPLPLLTDLTIAIAAAPTAPNSRIDIIEVRADRLKTDSQVRQVFDNAAEAFSSDPVDKTLEFLLDGTKLGAVTSPTDSTDAISLKQGIAGTPGVAPAVTAGYVKVAEVFVDGDVVLINQVDITDFRAQLINSLQTDTSIKTAIIPPGAGWADTQITGTPSANFGIGGWSSRSGDIIEIWLEVLGEVKAGDRILGVDLFVHDRDEATAATLDCSLREQALPGNPTVLISDVVTSDGSGDEQEVALTSIDFNGSTNILEVDKRYFLRVRETGAVKPTLLRVYGARITFDTPL